jgi:carboxyl-terminal processing protease
LILGQYVGSSVTPETLYEGAMSGMMSTLDPYSQYLSPSDLASLQDNFAGNYYGIGITLQADAEGNIEIGTVLKDSPADQAGVKTGDILLQINGTDVSGMDLDALMELMDQDESVNLKLERGGSNLDFTVSKGSIKLETVTSSKFEDLLPDAKGADNSDLGYIYISEFGDDTATEFKNTITSLENDGVKRIVLDLRGNPGGYADVVIDICRMIVPKGPIMYTIDKKDKHICFTSDLETEPFDKIIVLTDNSTASAAEVLASALQDSKAAIVVGEKSFGKGVIQSIYTLPVGGAVKLTTEEYLRRSGKKLNNIGITPDVDVEMPDLIMEPITLDDENEGDGVSTVRGILNFLGYNVSNSDSNVYDADMKAAVQKFQKDNGLTDDGELTVQTLIQLNDALYTKYGAEDLPLEKAYTLLKEN